MCQAYDIIIFELIFLKKNVVNICDLYIFVLIYIQVRYTSYRDRPHEERQNRFQMGCREGHVDIVR